MRQHPYGYPGPWGCRWAWGNPAVPPSDWTEEGTLPYEEAFWRNYADPALGPHPSVAWPGGVWAVPAGETEFAWRPAWYRGYWSEWLPARDPDAWTDVSPWTRQVTPHEGGPERITERHPHTKHVDWHSLYPDEIILRGPADRKVAALTFDDGPDNVWTPQILRVLSQYAVKATFMCVGRRVQQHPSVLQRIVREGHVVGNHSFSHPNLTKIPIAEVRNQIVETENEIQRIAGVRPRFFRPPYGALSDEVIREVRALGDLIIFWDVDSLDWAGLTPAQVAANVLAHTAPGAIILMHCAGGVGESLANTVQALPYIIQTLREEGYTLTTVSDMIRAPAYKS
ncbi:MAG: polysaccharide deacetylase family protein [Alicyclobacillus sp.]|nr:polysaccharide deacetylase family protein [Alicyclobacillus sp.]